MERRNFLVSAMLAVGVVKSALASKKSSSKKIGKDEFLISDDQDYVYLKRNETYHLPEKPESISSLIQFDIRKYRFGKSPEIKLNGQKFNGQKVETLVLTKDIQLDNKTQFIMQYTGEDIGWVLFV